MPGVRTSRQRPAPPGLLAELGNAGRPADRDGSGAAVEACPAASLEPDPGLKPQASREGWTALLTKLT